MHAHAWCVLICFLELLPARAACVLAGNTCFELTRLETEPCWTAAQRKHKGNCCFVVSEAQSGGSSERLFVCRTCPFWWWVCVCCMFKGVFWKGKRLQGKSESEFWLAPRSWGFCVSTEHGSVCVCGCRRSYFTSLIDQSTTESESLRTNLPSKKLPNVSKLSFCFSGQMGAAFPFFLFSSSFFYPFRWWLMFIHPLLKSSCSFL